MQKLSIDKQTLFFLGAIILAILEIFFLLPLSIKKISSTNKKITKIVSDLKMIEMDWPSKDQHLKNKEQLKQDIAKLRSKVVISQQESKLFSFISVSSKEFGIEIISLYPEQLKDYTSSEFGEYKYFPMTINVKCRFHDLARFLEHLQNSQYFLEVKTLNILPGLVYNSVEMNICGLIKQEQEQP